MNKAQKWTIEICLLLIVLSVLIPPYRINQGKTWWVNFGMIWEGWDFLWNIHYLMSKEDYHHDISFDILALEWIAIIALGGFFFLCFRKIK